MSLWKVFERSVRLYENKTALIFGEERISYKQLYEKSCHIADHLYEIAGGKEQQKVFILSKNSIDMVALMLACMRRNLIACPVNWRLSARELAVILKNHNYVIRICDEENRGLLEAACSFVPEETFVKADLRDLTDDKKQFLPYRRQTRTGKILLSSFLPAEVREHRKRSATPMQV